MVIFVCAQSEHTEYYINAAMTSLLFFVPKFASSFRNEPFYFHQSRLIRLFFNFPLTTFPIKHYLHYVCDILTNVGF